VSVDMHALTAKGIRPTMEDTHVLWQERDTVAGAIFDGHVGGWVSELGREMFAEAKLDEGPGAVLRRINEVALDSVPSRQGGACAVTFVLSGQRLQVANVGDAELVTVARDGSFRVHTEMHRLSNPRERDRVLAAGALVEGVYMVNPRIHSGLMPTRSLGDALFTTVGLVGEPYEHEATFGEGWLVAACDGLWDVVEPGKLGEILDGCESAETACYRLMHAALDRGTTDNVTVLAVRRR
jgi:serine/threonine protein phosphatase PrpC